jgi:hypothetical protein
MRFRALHRLVKEIIVSPYWRFALLIWLFAFFGALAQVAYEVGYRYIETKQFVSGRTLGYLLRWAALIVIIGGLLTAIQSWGEKE